MDSDLTLKEAHDVSEGLQKKVEKLPYVERCFVHCDYELDGDEHLRKFRIGSQFTPQKTDTGSQRSLSQSEVV